jgi:hypothetical protein
MNFLGCWIPTWKFKCSETWSLAQANTQLSIVLELIWSALTIRVVVDSSSLHLLNFPTPQQKNAAFVWDVGSRNRTRRNDAVLQPEMRYEVLHGDRLRFADLECVFERKEEDILVPDSQGLHRKSANVSFCCVKCTRVRQCCRAHNWHEKNIALLKHLLEGVGYQFSF